MAEVIPSKRPPIARDLQRSLGVLLLLGSVACGAGGHAGGAEQPVEQAAPSAAASHAQSDPAQTSPEPNVGADGSGQDAGPGNLAEADAGVPDASRAEHEGAEEQSPHTTEDALSTCMKDDDCIVTRYAGCCCEDAATPNYYAISEGDLESRQMWCRRRKRVMECDSARCPPSADDQPEPPAREAVCRNSECVSVPAE